MQKISIYHKTVFRFCFHTSKNHKCFLFKKRYSTYTILFVFRYGQNKSTIDFLLKLKNQNCFSHCFVFSNFDTKPNVQIFQSINRQNSKRKNVGAKQRKMIYFSLIQNDSNAMFVLFLKNEIQYTVTAHNHAKN